MRARDNELKVKQEILKKVFDSTIEDMKNIEPEKYIDYIRQNAAFNEGSEFVIMENMKDIIGQNLPDIKVIDNRYVGSDFIEIVGGIERNFTFDIKLNYIKDDIQGELAKVLFLNREVVYG